MKKNKRVMIGHAGGFRMLRTDMAERTPSLVFDKLDYDGRYLYLSVVFKDKNEIMKMDKLEMAKVKVDFDNNSFKVYTHRNGTFRITAKPSFTKEHIEILEQLMKGVK